MRIHKKLTRIVQTAAVIATLYAIPAYAQYHCEFTPVGAPICPPGTPLMLTCPLCPPPGIPRVTNDDSVYAKARTINQLREQLNELNTNINNVKEQTLNSFGKGGKRGYQFESDEWARIMASTAYGDSTMRPNPEVSDDADFAKTVDEVMASLYIRSDTSAPADQQLKMREKRKKIYDRLVVIANAKAEYAETLVRDPNSGKSVNRKMWEAVADQMKDSKDLREDTLVLASAKRATLSQEMRKTDLYATLTQLRSMRRIMDDEVILPSEYYDAAAQSARAAASSGSSRIDDMQSLINSTSIFNSTSNTQDVTPGTPEYTYRSELIRRVQVDFGIQLGSIVNSCRLDPARNDPHRDGYCPSNPNDPTKLDASPEAQRRLFLLGNVSHCACYDRESLSGKQPGELVFNTPYSRAQSISMMHNYVAHMNTMQQDVKLLDDMVACSHWADQQAADFKERVKPDLTRAMGFFGGGVTDHGPYRDPNPALGPIMNALSRLAPLPYYNVNADPSAIAASALNRHRDMANAACSIADALMQQPQDYFDEGAQRCVPRQVFDPSSGRSRMEYCLANDLNPPQSRMALAPVNIPFNGGQQRRYVIPGDQCRQNLLWGGRMIGPPLGNLAKWLQAEKIADMWYNTACGTDRNNPNVACGSNDNRYSAERERVDLRAEMDEVSRSFWARLQGLNDADDRAAANSSSATSRTGETAYLDPVAPSPNATSLRTNRGKNKAQQAISKQVEKLQAEIQDRYRRLAQFEAEAAAISPGTPLDSGLVSLKQHMNAQAARRRADLQKLDQFVAAMTSPANQSCIIRFEPTETQPVTIDCPNRPDDQFLCYNKPFTPGRPQVYWSPDIVDQ